MREIKFRAWDTETKTMLDRDAGYFVEFDGSVWFNCGDGYNDALQSQNGIILMQYTGLKDKNGREIYEGDILAFSAREWYGLEYEKGMKDYAFEVEQDATGEWVGAGGCLEWSVFCEVIGNIYENKEIINERLD
jgi:uncharacterized phage protein (TIGR01671 family)